MIDSEDSMEPLGEVAEIIMGQSPPGSTYNEFGDGLPFYQGVADFGERYPTRRVYCSAPTRIAKEGDVLFSVRAPIGRVNLAVEKCAIGRGLAIIRGLNPVEQTYLEFVLRAEKNLWDALESQGSVFGCAKKKDLEELSIPWPEENVRGSIAYILGTLDDKIELNRRMNETLEEMAKALFKSWFIDFDPIRAKMEGKPTGLPMEIEFLFPDKLVCNDDLEKEVPEGWDVKELSDVTKVIDCLHSKKPEKIKSGTP